MTKTLIPPDGYKEFLVETKAKLAKKYGDDWHLNQVAVGEFEGLCMDFDKKFLKDSIKNNVVLAAGKKMATARKKLYFTYGTAKPLVPKPHATAIIASLEAGIPFNAKDFGTLTNDIAAGAAAKGLETQKGGVIAATLTNATHQYIVIDNSDCGDEGDDGIVTSDMIGYTLVIRW